MYEMFGTHADSRVEGIVNRILVMTKARKLQWHVNGDVITTAFEGLRVRVTPGLMSPTLYIYDNAGNQLTTFGSATLIADPFSSAVSTRASAAASLVSDLYETAKRIALGTDEKLDVIDKALDRVDKGDS